MNRLSWLPVSGATGYRIYRGTQNAARADFQRLKDVAAGVTSYTDDGVDEVVGGNPPASNTSGLTMSPVQVEPGNLSIINFGRANIGDEPVAGSNCSIDYDYYVGRRDIIYATTREIKRLEGSPADWPKLPIVPEGTLGLCSVDCPPNSVDLTVQNFGLTRVTMDQIHEIIKDVEDLKYNDAQFQMNNELQNRDAQTKKGVYSDDFSNDAQSDIYHSEWSARIDRVRRFAAPARTASATVLTVNPLASNALFKGSLALLPATERVLVEQTDWSEVKNINPYAVFEKPDASVEITPNIGRRGQTGIAVVGSNFQSNANNVTIRCDGQVVASGVHADTAGRVSASFVIPENVRNGNRIVEMTDGLYSARAGIQINDPMVITRIERIVEERIIRVPVVQVVWRTQIVTVRNDPLAQTFSFTEDKVVSGVGLYFTAKDPSIPVTVQIRGVTTGLPNGVIFAEKVLAPGDVSLNVETKVVFANPFYAQAGTSYAVVLLTNSSNYRMRVATLGQLGQNGVITRQTYAAGVLLESSNAETWTPLNGSDLTMKIYGYDFQPSGEVRFQPITGVQFSDLNLDEYSSVPQGTGIAWEYSTDGGVLWDAIVPAEEERLPNLASQVLVRALFSSNAANISPALIYKDVNIIGYLNNTTGKYLNRENELTQGVSSTKIYTQMNIPSGTTINWFASNNGGATWEAMSILTTRKIDEEWTEYTLTRTFSDPNGNRVRYKAEMTGNNLVYPRIHTLGATLS